MLGLYSLLIYMSLNNLSCSVSSWARPNLSPVEVLHTRHLILYTCGLIVTPGINVWANTFSNMCVHLSSHLKTTPSPPVYLLIGSILPLHPFTIDAFLCFFALQDTSYFPSCSFFTAYSVGYSYHTRIYCMGSRVERNLWGSLLRLMFFSLLCLHMFPCSLDLKWLLLHHSGASIKRPLSVLSKRGTGVIHNTTLRGRVAADCIVTAPKDAWILSEALLIKLDTPVLFLLWPIKMSVKGKKAGDKQKQVKTNESCTVHRFRQFWKGKWSFIHIFTV